MPGGDGTGPLGGGPRTGRIAGFCAGADQPGYMNPFPGRGRRRGWGGNFRFGTAASAGPAPVDQGTLGQRLDKIQNELAALRKLIGAAESSNPGGQGQ